jgi:hypothetical protein
MSSLIARRAARRLIDEFEDRRAVADAAPIHKFARLSFQTIEMGLDPLVGYMRHEEPGRPAIEYSFHTTAPASAVGERR